MGIPLEEFRRRLAEDQDEPARITICRGPPRCDRVNSSCDWCYVIDSDDPRSTDQILADMKAEGH